MKQQFFISFLLIIFALFLDMLLFSIAQKPLSLFLVGFYYLYLNTPSVTIRTALVLCLMLESVIFTTHVYSFVVIVVPFTLIDYLIARLFQIDFYLRASCYFCLTIISYNAFYQGISSLWNPYTLGLICVTLIVMKYIEITLKVD